MRKYINRNSIIVLIVSTISFIFLSNNYDSILIRNIDESVLNWLVAHTQYLMVYIFEFITLLASWQMIILISIVLFVVERDKIQILLIPVITGISAVMNETIKTLIMRPRPNVLALTHANGYSMPSGHSLSAVIFYGLIIILVVSKIKDVRYRRLAQVLICALVVLIGFSRMYLRVHYLSDVVAGFSLGLIIISIVYNVKVGVFDNITTYLEEENNE